MKRSSRLSAPQRSTRIRANRSPILWYLIAVLARSRILIPLTVAALITGAVAIGASAGGAAVLPVVALPSAVIGQVEGNAGSSLVRLTASLTPTSSSPVTVHYTTASGTATSLDNDFTPTAGTLTFAPGETAAPITVAVVGDTKLEDHQRFVVRLSAPNGATIGHGTQTIEIRNDEKPKLTMAVVTVAEGAPAHFIPKLLQRYYLPITVTAQTANKTATSPADYTAVTTPVTFAADTRIGSAVDINTIADGLAEPNETFALNLNGVDVFAAISRVATISASVGTATCNTGQTAPAQYQKVVVFSLENRQWSTVGGVGFGATDMPYAHNLATSCSFFTTWTEATPGQNSATQYVGQAQGDNTNTVLNDCQPSTTCNSQADNIYRQARVAGKTAINYVEGPTTPCSTTGNAVKHVPALYFWGADDQAHCSEQVRPYSEFNPQSLPSYSFITPTLCNDGHDCANAIVDGWLQANVQPVIASADYQAGTVLIEIWYDEDSPAPNLYITPSARPGPFATTGVGYASTLRLWENVLGLPCLANACTAADIRPITGI